LSSAWSRCRSAHSPAHACVISGALQDMATSIGN
jgi:hypothetical protein